MNRDLRMKAVVPAAVAALAACAPPVAMDAPVGPWTPPPQERGLPGQPLADAVRQGETETIRALVRSGVDVNAAEGDGMTALHWAAHLNQAEAAEILIVAGARLEPRTRIGGYTPLLVASRVGAAEVTELLLAAGADVRARTTAGGTSALHFAAQAGNPRAVEMLLRYGAAVDERDGHWGHTPLMVAAAEGRLDGVRALLAAGADLSLRNRALDMAERAQEDQRLRELRNRQLAFQRELEQEANALAQSGEVGRGETDYARADSAAEATSQAAAGQTAEREAAQSAEDAARAGGGASAETEDEEEEEPQPGIADIRPLSYAELVGGYGGFSAIHLAARQGHRDVVLELLAAGAELNAMSEGDGTSVLLIATVNGHWDLAMELLARGADPNLASDAGVTPLYGVINLQWAPRALHPQPRAHLNQETQYLEAMERLLEAGADPNVQLSRHLWYKSYNFDLLGVDTWGASPFWRAAYGTDVAAMRLLLAYGADPTVPTRRPASRRGGYDGAGDGDHSGLPPVPLGGPSVTPLHAAAGVGYGEGFAANAHRHVPGGWLPAVRFLVEEIGLDVNARDHNGFTPLHHAAARGDLDVIRYLVERGADVSAVSRSGLTTADMANGPAQRVPPYPRAIALLRELGSNFNDRCLSC